MKQAFAGLRAIFQFTLLGLASAALVACGGGGGDGGGDTDTSTSWSVASSSFPTMLQNKTVKIGDTLYSVGLPSGSPTALEVWKSTDGANWSKVTLATGTGAPPPWQGYAIATNGSYILLIGGIRQSGNSTYTNNQILKFDPVTSTWYVMGENNAFASYYVSLAYAGGSFYFFDARDTQYTYMGIVKSSDGIKWTELVKSSGPGANVPYFGVRIGACVVTDGTTLYMMGGVDENNVNKKDVWSSTDGRNWTQQTTSIASDIGSFGAGCTYANGRIYYASGFNPTDINTLALGTASNKMYSSADGGKSWRTESSTLINGNALPGVGWLGLASLGSTLYATGGYSPSDGVFPYVFRISP